MHYFKEEWRDSGVEKDWPSLTKIYKASNSLGAIWHPFDHREDILIHFGVVSWMPTNNLSFPII